MLRGCLEVLVGCCQERQVVALAELHQQGIDGADLDPSAVADIADFGCCYVVVLVGLEEGEGGKALHELLSVFWAGKTLEELLEHQSRGEDLLATQESGTEGDHLRHAWLSITAKDQLPDRGVDQQAHRWRSRSALTS